MSNEVKITVYLPCRNYGRYLLQCLNSIKYQLFKDWELFIVNEASEDETEIIAKNFILENKDHYKIKYISNLKNLGVQKVANQVLEIASGKYIIRVDPDDWLDESALLVLFNKIESLHGCDLVYPDYYFVNEKGNIIANDRQLKFQEDDKVGITPPNGACCLIRSRALKLIGGYSENFNAQDGHELWFKLTSRMKSAHVSLPLFYYRQHSNSLSRDDRKLLKARQLIYNTISKNNTGNYELNIVGIIPVKESFPDINNIPFLKHEGKTLLEIAIEGAYKSETLTNLVISGGNQKTLDFAKNVAKNLNYRNLILDKRSKDELINSEGVPTLDLMKKAGELFKNKNAKYPDIIIFLNLHAFHRKSEDIKQSISLLKLTNSDSVVSVNKERKPIFKYGTYGLDILNEGRLSDISLQREILFSYEGSIIATWWDILQENKIFGEKITPLEIFPKNDILSIKNLKA